MNLSDDRINHLSHLILGALKKAGWSPFADEMKGLGEIKKAMREFGETLEVADSAVRQKIATLKRNVPEGSREWDVLYRQYVEEELRKKGL